MNARDEVTNWLRDAYAMERGLEVSLKKISESDRHDAESRRAAAMHLKETQQHARIVESLLKTLGSDTSTIKTGTAIITETMKGLATAMSQDEQIKDLLAGYAMEHFEIGCYRALAAAAEAAGLPEVAEACEGIISDEQQMADTIEEVLPGIVQQHLRAATMAKAA